MVQDIAHPARAMILSCDVALGRGVVYGYIYMCVAKYINKLVKEGMFFFSGWVAFLFWLLFCGFCGFSFRILCIHSSSLFVFSHPLHCQFRCGRWLLGFWALWLLAAFWLWLFASSAFALPSCLQVTSPRSAHSAQSPPKSAGPVQESQRLPLLRKLVHQQECG